MTYDVDVTTLVYGGEALARLPDGRAVFIPFTLPGEKVRIRLTEDKRNFARAELIEVLQPSPDRVEPLCIHFGLCGGCHYQHIPYPLQLQWKQEIVRDQLQRIGKIADPPVQETVLSPENYYYRNYIQFHLTPEGQLGYHKWGSDQVFAAKECHLPKEQINYIWPQLDFEALPEISRVGLRLGEGEDIQVTLESEELETPEMTLEEMDISVVHLSPAGALVMAGSSYLIMQVFGRAFKVSAASFFQVNTPMAGALVTHLLEGLTKRQALGPQKLLMDLYCGVGLFSAFLAPHVGRLVGVEASPSAADDFVVNLDEFENVELYEAEVEEVLPQLDLHPDTIVLDPPRAGLAPQVIDALRAMAPTWIAYVSCDPATMARDGKRLTASGYSLDQVIPFDLFPQTYHIETLSFWRQS